MEVTFAVFPEASVFLTLCRPRSRMCCRRFLPCFSRTAPTRFF